MKVLVTGGCQGLGLTFTKELSNRGHKVYAIYHKSVDTALELENEYDNVRCIKCDIRKESEVENLFFNLDNIDLIINNAAIAKDNDYKEKTASEFLSVLETNVVGTFLVTKYGIDAMSKNGVIINISSNNALSNNNPISMDYDASKAGVNMLTRDFSLLNNGIKYVSICPGWIATPSVLEMNPDFITEELKRSEQDSLIIPDKLVNKILNEYNTYENGSIIEIKEV